jgi:hypothetical protein
MEYKNLQYYIALAEEGSKASIDEIMRRLNRQMTIAESKFIDFALSHIDSEEGTEVMKHYLFHGTQLQRNYCTLYFSRLGEYPLVREAYDKGLIDAKQAFSR